MTDKTENVQQSTLTYYNQNATEFCNDTFLADISDHRKIFTSYLPLNAAILDLGCGSGRDSRAFIEMGYQVDAADGSEELCKIASQLIGKTVKCQQFQELDADNIYDGIWACASILHLPLSELEDVMIRIHQALKQEGILYTSFKYGEFEGMRNGRYFTCLTETAAADLIDRQRLFDIEKMWVSADARPGRSAEKWLNLILRKRD